MHLADWILLAVLAVWLALALCVLRRRKQRGKGIGCGGDCAVCTGCARRPTGSTVPDRQP